MSTNPYSAPQGWPQQGAPASEPRSGSWWIPAQVFVAAAGVVLLLHGLFSQFSIEPTHDAAVEAYTHAGEIPPGIVAVAVGAIGVLIQIVLRRGWVLQAACLAATTAVVVGAGVIAVSATNARMPSHAQVEAAVAAVPTPPGATALPQKDSWDGEVDRQWQFGGAFPRGGITEPAMFGQACAAMRQIAPATRRWHERFYAGSGCYFQLDKDNITLRLEVDDEVGPLIPNQQEWLVISLRGMTYAP